MASITTPSRTMRPLLLLRRPHPPTRRSFAGGYQGPTSRGMGRDGGGRGPGGKHRSPRGGGGGAGAGKGEGEEGEGAFAAFQKKRREAIERDLDAARRATAEAAGGGTGAGVGGFGPSSGPQKPGVRIHRQTNHPPRGAAGQGQQGRGRPPHRGGPPKSNYAENVLRPAAEGHAAGSTKSKHASGIPKLAARRPKGHQVHDAANLDAALPPGQRRSGRAAVRGEMRNRVRGDLEGVEAAGSAAGGDDAEEGAPEGERGNAPVSGLAAMMAKRRAGGGEGLAALAPTRDQGGPVPERRFAAERRPPSSGGYPGRGGDRRSPGGYPGRGGDRGGDRRSFDNNADEDEGFFVGHYEYDDAYDCADQLQAEERRSAMETVLFPNVNNQDDDGYDSDADLDPPITEDDPDYMDLDNHELVRKNWEGDYVFDWEGLDELAIRKMKEDGEWEDAPQRPGQREFVKDEDENASPFEKTFEYDYYFRDITALEENNTNPYLLETTEHDSGAMLPLKPHGPDLDDFLFALTNHPSKYAVIEKRAEHPDSQRSAHPMIPDDRTLPDAEFVERYKGYLYVTGLVPHLDPETGEVKDFDDALHRQDIQEAAANLFGVTTLDVSPASPTSAFIGFGTKLQAKEAMIKSIEEEGSMAVEHPIDLMKYEAGDEESMSTEEKEFVALSQGGPESILKVTGLPAQTTSAELLQSMFPPGSRLEAMFGPLTSEDYFRSSSTSALINMASPDLVGKALKSDNIKNNASTLGKRTVQVFRAKRERVFDAWVGVNKHQAQSKLGTRLLVTGDKPPQEMFLSHNDMLHVSGLPPNVTLNDLATFFQPFSADRRDVFGSGHIVRCSKGIPTGCAYIGFELPGEIDQAVEVYKGRAFIGGAEVKLRQVMESGFYKQRGVREGARPARSVEELRSDLYDWERHVDPKDIQELEQLGIEKGVLDEVMITLRHNNRTFAAGDQAMAGERLYEEREVGTHYRDVVRNYIETLKSCVGTKENPGLLYEAMFRPDEDVDMGLLDMEEKRIQELRKKGVE